MPPDLYDIPVPGEEGSIRAILGHVVEAGYSHVSYVAKHCGGKIPQRRFADPTGLTDAETFTAALLDVGRFAREALAPVPDIFQTIGSAARNLGLIAMGYAVLVRSRLNESPATRF